VWYKVFSPTYHPQSNGAAENEVKTVKRALLKQLFDKKTETRSLDHKIDAFLFTYRNTPHTATKISPAELFLGRRPRTPLTLLQPGNVLKIKMKEQQQKRMAGETLKISTFIPGDLVWVKAVNHGKIKWLPGVIESVISSVSYMVQAHGKVSERVRPVSSSHLRRRSPNANTIEEEPITMQHDIPEVIPEITPPVIPIPEPVLGIHPTPPATPAVVVEQIPTPPPGTPAREIPESVPVQEPQHSTPKRPPSARKPQVEVPATVPVFTRRGRAVVPPKRLLD